MAKKAKFDYFDAFEKQTKLAVQEADLLIEAVEKFTEAEKLKEVMERAHELEHEGDETVAGDFTNTRVNAVLIMDNGSIRTASIWDIPQKPDEDVDFDTDTVLVDISEGYEPQLFPIEEPETGGEIEEEPVQSGAVTDDGIEEENAAEGGAQESAADVGAGLEESSLDGGDDVSLS